jgi:fatty acid-binding protein DegV
MAVKIVTDSSSDISDIAVVHAMKPDWACSISDRLASSFPGKPVHLFRLSVATGIHGGPDAIAIAFIENAERRISLDKS